ncbi:hypothetical protein Prudu_013254 [Prunus dulcis]|uniref:Uncharacterized protein n=1 Tax=Prunus dulcis TaxID=3755 RepID=A0A4Y1RED2_PRUDU|nr:hypothetical protein Prudu_013254 [Prunus dulcis]
MLHCTKRSAAQWQVVIRRTYPWFQTGFRLFEKEPEDEAARTDFRKKFLSITLPRDLPHGGGKPPNYHLGAEVYHPNFCARQLGCPQLIPLKSYRSCNRASSWRDADDLEVHKDARCAVNKSTTARMPSIPHGNQIPAIPNLPASVTALKVLFDGWENWLVFADGEARAHMIQTIKVINAQIIEDPSLTKNVGGQSVQAENWESFSSSTKLKKLKKKSEVEYVAVEEAAAIQVSPSGTDDELREAFEEVEQEKELQELEEVSQKKVAVAEDDDEIPAEVIAESIALAQKQQKGPSAELTSSKLALFDDAGAEHSTAAPEAEDRWKCLKLLMPIHSLPGSSATASFADPELEEFEAMDLDAQLDKLEKLSSPPSRQSLEQCRRPWRG